VGVRRVLYNFIVLIAGILSIFLLYLFAGLNDINLETGENLFEPMAIPAFAILCNLAYTLGWVAELFNKRGVNLAPKLFKRGLFITLIIVFLGPAMHLLSTILNTISTVIN